MRFSDASMDVYVRPVVLQQDEKSRTERTQWNTSLTYEGKTAGNAYSGEVYYSRLKKYSETWNDRPDFRELLQGFPTAMVRDWIKWSRDWINWIISLKNGTTTAPSMKSGESAERIP